MQMEHLEPLISSEVQPQARGAVEDYAQTLRFNPAGTLDTSLFPNSFALIKFSK